MPTRKTLDYYINKANIIHNNKYDYSLIEFDGVMNKVKIKCPKHDIWEVTLDNHINKKSGCPKCKGRNKTKEEKIIDANIIHNNEYDYSYIEGKQLKTSQRVKIKHVLCGAEFHNSWDNHINKKQGCPKCNIAGRKKLTIDDVRLKILNLNNIEYEYNWDSYMGYFKKIQIKCLQHGWFEQQVSNHLMGQKCPKCIRSIGEETIEKLLKLYDINYDTQKTFEGCVNPKTQYKLRFDFYISELNLCVEYDGELHYKSVEHFGGDKTLDKSIYLDGVKSQYCKDNNVNLLRISYLEINNIENIIHERLNYNQ
jgi:Zn finger protein HypA/HybF involved in hydrogenase expression